MRAWRAVLFGILGAASMSLLSAGLRAVRVDVSIELILGTLTGVAPGARAFSIGLVMHLGIGALFGVVYGLLFERVWAHGGAGVGMLLGVIHATLVGMAIGLTPHFHPFIPSPMGDPGPYFANLGAGGVIAFFVIHVVYGAIVGAGYGHVAAEHEWAPASRL